jgi:hypothetical protein
MLVDIAKRSGSVPLFSILTILIGLWLADEWRKGNER